MQQQQQRQHLSESPTFAAPLAYWVLQPPVCLPISSRQHRKRAGSGIFEGLRGSERERERETAGWSWLVWSIGLAERRSSACPFWSRRERKKKESERKKAKATATLKQRVVRNKHCRNLAYALSFSNMIT
jgi:hypothetical protein